MANGKNDKPSVRRYRKRKTLILVLCLTLVLSLAVGGTLAYIVANGGNVENLFKSSEVSSRVNVNGDTIDVTNTGDVDAYIRAAIVVNWMDAEGNVRGIAPVESVDYELSVNTDDWYQDSTTLFYYYKDSVPSDGVTEDLVNAITVLVTPPEGYELSVEVVAEAIQAEGMGADVDTAQEAWAAAVKN